MIIIVQTTLITHTKGFANVTKQVMRNIATLSFNFHFSMHQLFLVWYDELCLWDIPQKEIHGREVRGTSRVFNGTPSSNPCVWKSCIEVQTLHDAMDAIFWDVCFPSSFLKWFLWRLWECFLHLLFFFRARGCPRLSRTFLVDVLDGSICFKFFFDASNGPAHWRRSCKFPSESSLHFNGVFSLPITFQDKLPLFQAKLISCLAMVHTSHLQHKKDSMLTTVKVWVHFFETPCIKS